MELEERGKDGILYLKLGRTTTQVHAVWQCALDSWCARAFCKAGFFGTRENAL